MKKMLMTLTAIALSVAMVSTVDARYLLKKAEVTQGSTARKLAEQANLVIEAVKNVQEEELAPEAMEEAKMSVEELLANLHQRDWKGDLGGYTEDQKIEAGKKIELLEVERRNLMAKIDIVKADVEGMTDKGWFWNARKKEVKEDEFSEAKSRLNTLNASLKNVDKAIANQTVIAGRAYAKAIKAAVAATMAAATAGVIYLADVYGFTTNGKAFLSTKLSEFEVATRPAREKMGKIVTEAKKRLSRTPAPKPAPKIQSIPEPEYQ